MMNKQQAIEFVQSELDISHRNYCNSWAYDDCDCGKDQRDVKLRELLYYLQHGVKYNFDLANFVEYMGEE